MRLLLFLMLFFSARAHAGDTTKLYNPAANAAQDVARLVNQAKTQNKRVLLQVGGNWCVPCYRLNAFLQQHAVLKNLVDSNYMVYHLNYSPQNKNEAYLKTLGSPQRYGVPVLVVLDSAGKWLFTQTGGALQKGNGYSLEKVKAFLTEWAPLRIDE